MHQPSDGRCRVLNKLYQLYCRSSLFGFHVGLLVLAGLLCFARQYTGNPAMTDYAYAVFVVDIFSVLIHTNQQGIYEYMRMNKDVSHVPRRQIYLINTLLLTGFLTLTGGCMFLFVHLPYRSVLGALKTIFVTVLRWIFRHLLRQEPVAQEEVASTDFSDLLQGLPRSQGVPWYAKLLEYLFLIIAAVSIAAIVILLLVAIYRKLTSGHTHMELDQREFVSPKMERRKVVRTRSKDRLRFFDRSTEGRIRKLYYRTIRRSLRSGKLPQKSMTPSQIERLANLSEAPGTDQLHAVYEKARYDTIHCSKEDLENAKAGASEISHR